MIAQRRVAKGIVAAPVAAAAASALVFAVYAFVTRDVAGIDAAALVWYSSTVGFVISVPVAYSTAILVSVACYLLLECTGDRRAASVVIATAAICGAIVWPLAWQWYANAHFSWLFVVTGLIAGFVGGSVFLVIVADQREPTPS